MPFCFYYAIYFLFMCLQWMFWFLKFHLASSTFQTFCLEIDVDGWNQLWRLLVSQFLSSLYCNLILEPLQPIVKSKQAMDNLFALDSVPADALVITSMSASFLFFVCVSEK